MATTTGAVVARNLKLELSANGTTWTDISGHSNKIELSGGERDTGSMPVFGNNSPIVTSGALKEMETKISIVYTEVPTEAYTMAKTAYEGGGDIYVRWSPKGGTTGNFQFTSGKGVLKNPPYPSADASDANPIMVELNIVIPSVSQATVA